MFFIKFFVTFYYSFLQKMNVKKIYLGWQNVKYFDTFGINESIEEVSLWMNKKLTDLNPKIVDALDEYHGFFKEYDKTYKNLNPQIELDEHFKMSNILKSTFSWFNKKKFDSILEPLMNDIEKILKEINYKRFEKDKKSMVKMFNYIYDKD